MKDEMKFSHNIEERNVEEIKKYFEPEVFIEYCKKCQEYGKIWGCPPYDFDTSKLIDSYRYVNIIGSKLYINSLGDNFKNLIEDNDLEYVSNEIYKAARRALDKKLRIFTKENEDVLVLFPGRCIVCNECTREEEKPCIHPDKMQLSLESLGFDVASICKDVLGDEILWAKENLPEYFIFVSGVFSKEKLSVLYPFDSE